MSKKETTTSKKSKSYLIHTVGRRKSSVARIYIAEGTGTITVNARNFKEYFTKPTDQYVVHQPLNLANVMGNYDILVNVVGGGTTGRRPASGL